MTPSYQDFCFYKKRTLRFPRRWVIIRIGIIYLISDARMSMTQPAGDLEAAI